MEITVLIEKVPLNGYRARTTELSGIAAEGATREEALTRIRELIDQRLAQGREEIVRIQVPAEPNPWLRLAGSLDPNDPVVQEWLEIIQENRKKADEDPDYL